MRSDFEFQIIWNRLIAVCEEQAQVMIRAAFSPPVRESGDLSAGFFDLKGRMLAQAVTGTHQGMSTAWPLRWSTFLKSSQSRP